MSRDVDDRIPVRERSSRLLGGVALLVAAGLLVGLGYLLGSHRHDTRTVVGPAQVGDHVATVIVDGTSYGFRDSIPWIDAAGAWHEGGWPACVGRPSPDDAPLLRLVVARVEVPDGSWLDQVVDVDCRA